MIRRKQGALLRKSKERGSPPPLALRSYRDPTSHAIAISPRVLMNSTATPTQILRGAPYCSQLSGRQTVSHRRTPIVLLQSTLPPTLPYPALLCHWGAPRALRSRYRCPSKAGDAGAATNSEKRHGSTVRLGFIFVYLFSLLLATELLTKPSLTPLSHGSASDSTSAIRSYRPMVVYSWILCIGSRRRRPGNPFGPSIARHVYSQRKIE